jgi:hypothetical protein
MAFYADVYGYVARKEAEEIPLEAVERAHQSAPIFRVAFAAPLRSRTAHYSSFACDVKFDEGEDELWLAPFEMLLKSINFLRATVVIVHEESSKQTMRYFYVKIGPTITRITTKLAEQTTQELEIA